jgi:hypothetical protein
MSVATGLLVVGIVSGNHWLSVVDLAYDHDATANQARLYLFFGDLPCLSRWISPVCVLNSTGKDAFNRHLCLRTESQRIERRAVQR